MLQSRLIKPVDTLRARGFSCVKNKKRPPRKAFGPERHPFDSAESSTLLIPKHLEFGCFADRFLWDVECFKCSDWITVREARDQDAGGLKVTKIKCKQSISSHICFCRLEESWKYQMAVRAIAKVIRTFDGVEGIQSNPAISNSVNSKSPLFRRKIEFPWIYPYVSSHLLSAISNSVISNSPLFRTHRSFPTP